MSKNNWGRNTQLIRGGIQRTNINETAEALFLNSGYCYDSAETAQSRFDGSAPGFVYSRYTNPTVSMFEERLALLDKASSAIGMGSGMAAVFASLMCSLKAGDHLIAGRVLFGSCHYVITKLLPKYGIDVTLVDSTDLTAWEKAFKPNTRAVFIESPANPTLELTDIKAVGELCKAHNAKYIVDNIVATPILQSPLELGADLVVHSNTKHFDGQGRCLGGAVTSNDDVFMQEELLQFFRHTGPHLSPFNAWIALKGLETLELRIERHCQNALAIADYLEDHQKVSTVFYPWLTSHPQHALAKKQMQHGGTLISFEVGSKEKAFNFMNRLELIDISNNFGDSKSLITNPATTTHSSIDPEIRREVGISDGLIRLSVGLEDLEDLIKDIDQGLSTV